MRKENAREPSGKGIDGDIKLNRALWLIAEDFKNHKS